MASFWSTYLKDKINDHLHGGTTYTAPATTYFGLMTVAPTPAGGGTEVTAISRLPVANNSTNWAASSSGLKTNAVVFTFTSSAPTSLGTIVGIAEFDAASGGNLLTYGDLVPASKPVPSGSAFTVAVSGGQFSYIDAS